MLGESAIVGNLSTYLSRAATTVHVVIGRELLSRVVIGFNDTAQRAGALFREISPLEVSIRRSPCVFSETTTCIVTALREKFK